MCLQLPLGPSPAGHLVSILCGTSTVRSISLIFRITHCSDRIMLLVDPCFNFMNVIE